MIRLLLGFVLLALAACSTSGPPLPMVDRDDPIWPLTLDQGNAR